MNGNIEKLTKQSKILGDDVYDVCKGVLEDDRFPLWSGSSQPHQHHYGAGGLIQHTSEVIDTCFRVKSLYEHKYEFDSKEVFLAAFFHDVGKMWDYERVEIEDPEDPAWTSAPHKRYIHHISRSAIVWSENAKKNESINDKYADKVLHAILSHHTAREFGSPVAPKSRVAWLLTLCDNLSARMFDCDTFDVLDRNKK
jgi:3'-5' exoribonuclease